MSHTHNYKDKVVLVTGGAGAIGRNLVEALSKLEAGKVIILDNFLSSYLWNVPDAENVLFIQGDVRNEDDLRRVFHHRPAVVFHLAAFFANQHSVDYPLICEDVNGRGIIKLLEYCMLSGCIERFVYTNSEGGAYGEGCSLPYREEEVSLQTGSPYYISKMAGEAYCHYYHKVHKLPVSILRLFNSYGPGEVPGACRNVIPNFIYWALKKQPLPLTGDRQISRDFVPVRQTVEGILRAGCYPDVIGKPINIATGEETLIYELAEMINLKTSNPAGITVLNQRKWDIRKKIFGSNEVCQQLLNFKPSTNLDIGLDETITWFQQNWTKIEQSATFTPGMNPALDVK